MKFKIYSIILGILFSVLCNSCSTYTIYPFYIPVSAPEIPNNSIKKDIPRYSNNDLFVYYIFAKQKQEQLGLMVPENGFDSLLVRMWFTYPMGWNQYGELFEFKIDSNKHFSAHYTKMSIFFNPSRRYENVKNHFDTIPSPKCGWQSFIDSLVVLKITELPTIENIPKYVQINGKDNFDYGNDKMTISVEVSTKNTYRFFQYNNLEKYKELDEVNRIYRFEVYLREQFNLRKNDKGWY